MLVKRKRRKGPGQEGLITASPFLMPSLIGLLVFSLLPLLISAFISLTDWNGLDQLTAPGFFQEHFIGLDNYKAILSSPEFWGVLWNTFRYIIMYIPLMLVASLGVAYLLSRQRPGVTAFRIIYYIPVLTSWVAASMIWKSMLSPEYGAVNNILAVFGIQGPGWLLDEAWAMSAIVLVSVWKDMGFFGLILLSGMVGINKSYYSAGTEAAQRTLLVNGESILLDLPKTQDWDSWNTVSVPVELLPGQNTITISYQAGNFAGINLDCISLRNQ